MRERPLDRIDELIIHCSDSPYGDVETIDGWHQERFREPCGYHFVICNTYPTQADYARRSPCLEFDGMIQHGRPLDIMGTHAGPFTDAQGERHPGHNWRSVGICLIGKKVFSAAQLQSLQKVVADVRQKLGRTVPIVCHHQVNPGKTCPNLSWPFLHQLLDKEL